MEYGHGIFVETKDAEGKFNGLDISYAFLPKGEKKWRAVSFHYRKHTSDVIGRVKHVLSRWEHNKAPNPDYTEIKIDDKLWSAE